MSACAAFPMLTATTLVEAFKAVRCSPNGLLRASTRTQRNTELPCKPYVLTRASEVSTTASLAKRRTSCRATQCKPITWVTPLCPILLPFPRPRAITLSLCRSTISAFISTQLCTSIGDNRWNDRMTLPSSVKARFKVSLSRTVCPPHLSSTSQCRNKACIRVPVAMAAHTNHTLPFPTGHLQLQVLSDRSTTSNAPS